MDETTITPKMEKVKGKTANKAGKSKTATGKKTTTAKATAKKANSKKPGAEKTASKNNAVISVDQRHAMIEKMAYLIAEKRGFVGGDPAQDWLIAESEIDVSITKGLAQSDSISH